MKYPYLPSAMRLVPDSEELTVPKNPEILTFSDDNSNSLEDHRQHGGENVDCNPRFEVSCSSLGPHLLIQDGLKLFVNFVRNLSKKQAEVLDSTSI
jgi:hypothetical protein